MISINTATRNLNFVMEHDMHSVSLKRITLTLARSKGFPNGSDQIGYELIAPWTSTVISIFRGGRDTVPHAAFVIFVLARMTKPACWCTSQVVPSMAAGYLIMMLRAMTTMRQAFYSDGMRLCRAKYVSILDAAGITHTFLIRSVTSFNSLNG